MLQIAMNNRRRYGSSLSLRVSKLRMLAPAFPSLTIITVHELAALTNTYHTGYRRLHDTNGGHRTQ